MIEREYHGIIYHVVMCECNVWVTEECWSTLKNLCSQVWHHVNLWSHFMGNCNLKFRLCCLQHPEIGLKDKEMIKKNHQMQLRHGHVMSSTIPKGSRCGTLRISAWAHVGHQVGDRYGAENRRCTCTHIYVNIIYVCGFHKKVCPKLKICKRKSS